MMLLYLGVIVLVFLCYVYSKNKYNYWTQKGVKGPKPSLLVGNFGKVIILKESVRDLLKDAYEKYPHEKVVGLYQGFTPVLLLRDPEIIKQVLIKDFSVFQDRGTKSTAGGSKLLKKMLKIDPKSWITLRQKITPLFSSKKIKNMVPLIEKCCDNYVEYVEHLIKNNFYQEIKTLKSKYTLQVIGLCIFGVQPDINNDKDRFNVMSKRIIDQSTLSTMFIMLDIIIPGISKLNTVTSDVDIQDFFLELVSKAIKQRENEMLKRYDFMDFMIELKENVKLSKNIGQDHIEIDDGLIAVLALMFYGAGFETSSAIMSFMVYELALHKDIQDKVYEEISTVIKKHDGKINYESVKEMTYLEMVFSETMRKHTASNFLSRKSVSEYVLPEVNVRIPKGTLLYISQSGIHNDKQYYDNPERFDPEHFAPDKIKERLPLTFLPFGDGPRNCIGKRFALIMSLMGMAAFLRRFRVELSAKTETTLDYNPTSISLQSSDGIWIEIIKR